MRAASLCPPRTQDWAPCPQCGLSCHLLCSFLSKPSCPGGRQLQSHCEEQSSAKRGEGWKPGSIAEGRGARKSHQASGCQRWVKIKEGLELEEGDVGIGPPEFISKAMTLGIKLSVLPTLAL